MTPTAEIRILATQGSTPREAGASMFVTAHTTTGTIGGGRLEHDAIAHARQLLNGENIPTKQEISLGPAINQCCGGKLTLSITLIDATRAAELQAEETTARQAQPTILLFGAGHVGRAIAHAIAPLPFNTIWLDQRAPEFGPVPPGIETRTTPDFATEIANAPPGSAIVILTHSHTLDAAILDCALSRDDFAYIGLIGSKSKRKRFESALIAAGHPEHRARTFTCPIGANPTGDKRPEIIAVFVVAELARVLLTAK